MIEAVARDQYHFIIFEHAECCVSFFHGTFCNFLDAKFTVLVTEDPLWYVDTGLLLVQLSILS